MYDLLIIGSGPAGLGAAVNAASEGLKVGIIAGERGGQAGGSSRIENYLGFEDGISGVELMATACRQANRFGAEFIEDRARALQHITTPEGEFQVITELEERLSSRAVLLAMGVDYRRLDVAGEELPEVSYGLDPTEQCAGHTVIVGGANSAGQAALHAASSCDHVTLLTRSPLEKSMSHYLIERINNHSQISVAVGEVRGIRAGQGLDGLGKPLRITTDVRPVDRIALVTLKADRLAIFIGATPRTSWLPAEIRTDAKGFIVTDGDTSTNVIKRRDAPTVLPFETSCPGVFAAGDVRHGSIKRVAGAVGEGSQAVSSIHRYLNEET